MHDHIDVGTGIATTTGTEPAGRDVAAAAGVV
jgi:hypothetical protein